MLEEKNPTFFLVLLSTEVFHFWYLLLVTVHEVGRTELTFRVQFRTARLKVLFQVAR